MRPWTALRRAWYRAMCLRLQWGHGLAAVDGSAAARRRASAACFNGATALRPWTASALDTRAELSLGFNGATALRPWTARRGRQDVID